MPEMNMIRRIIQKWTKINDWAYDDSVAPSRGFMFYRENSEPNLASIDSATLKNIANDCTVLFRGLFVSVRANHSESVEGDFEVFVDTSNVWGNPQKNREIDS